MSTDVLDRVTELARERADGQGEMLAAFARAYLRRPAGAEGELADDPEALLAEVRGAFAVADRRGTAPVAVSAFTPRRAEHGYDTEGSVLETNTADIPFLVDSVTAELRARGVGAQRVVHPIIGIERDRSGAIVNVTHPRDAARESVMHFELDRRLAPDELATLEDAVRAVLTTVRACVEDFPAMRQGVERLAEIVKERSSQDTDEAVAFLEWLLRGHFVLLGFAEGDSPGLGLLRPRGPLSLPHGDPPAPAADAAPIEITKTSALSPVHKRLPMDAVLAGDARLLGLFTSRAYAEPASSTPLLRHKLQQIVAAEDLIEGSHDYKAAVATFDSFPKDELFAAPVADLRAQLAALLALQGDDVRVLLRESRDRRGASVVVAISRERHSAALRDRLRALVSDAFGSGHVDVHEVLGEGDRVQIHLTARGDDLPHVELGPLQERVARLARTWTDRVTSELVRRHGAERGRMLAARWLGRLPEAYRAGVDPAVAAYDVGCFERLHAGAEGFVVGLQEDGDRTRVSFVKRGPKIELSQATPMLEHLGLRVIEELPMRLHGDEETWLQAFAVAGPRDTPIDLAAAGDRIAEALTAVWRGATESDPLNRLVIAAGLDWRQVDILRAYRRYRQRIGSRYTESFQTDVIVENPEITAKLMELFELRFGIDDAARAGGTEAEERLRAEILEDLENVELLDHDRILRNQLGLIDATVRTNVYRRDRDAMAFKLRSADVPAIPEPPPLFEIYVYAADMEGIHLRGGRLARGGLRWSDRMDYRTEVFGLLRAQMTKNAIIVPAGAKGGFFLKRRPDDAAALRDEVRRQYVRYIEALLDVTDNLVDGEVDPPTDVRVRDEDDTYLVVAADKGTAALSDTANEVSVRRGFWLGDAFASGGSTGYDHKALGITAKGAWESVKRHFRELGVDPERDSVTVVGIGDMSGDVFGNGMLLSRSLRLIAAYDHRHVFIDPDPDPERSFDERRRLFELPGSSWDDYDRELLSEGGGIWRRGAKRIRLSPQAREALGIEDEELPPTEVIRAILRAPADLLWNGGIGTVVKACAEADADAKDRSSDAIRVDARDLRCKVIGEGGNLGLTQRARIEYAQAGGRVNADFIDNSAGVDCSDHEVNLKILLDLAVRRRQLDGTARNDLLREVTDDVEQHVLYDSFLQAQILAQEERASAARLFAYEDLMEGLETESDPPMLRRDAEALPASDAMAERRRAGHGLVRPELAVLLAYAKRSLTDALLHSALPEDPHFARDLRSYFPRAVVERFGELIDEHPLRRELVATIVANDVVNALGPTAVSGLARELGCDAAQVVRAYRIAREVCGATQRWLEVEGTEADVSHDVIWRLMAGVDELVGDLTRWYLLHAPAGDLDTIIGAAHGPFVELADMLGDLRSDAWRQERDAIVAELVDAGVDPDVARRHAYQPALVYGPDIISVAQTTGREIEDVARAFFAIGEGLRLEWLERECDALPATSRIQRWAVQALRDEILSARRVLAQRALEEAPEGGGEEAVQRFLESCAESRRRLGGVARVLAVEGDAGLAGLTVAVRHLRALTGQVV